MIKHCISVIFFLFLLSCKDHNGIPEPEKLIEKDVMVDIMYDLSVLEAIKYQNPASLDSFKINASAFIFKKYKVDSIQYIKNTKYYAADDEVYKTMYEKVIKRLEANVKKADSLAIIDKKKAKAKKNKIKPVATTKSDAVN
jgi:hypothetical protein